MSLDPFIYCIVGIDDAVRNDPRHVENIEDVFDMEAPTVKHSDDLEFNVRMLKHDPDHPIYMDRVFFHGSLDGETLQNIVGFIVEEVPSEAARWMACLNKDEGEGYKKLPKTPMSEWMKKQRNASDGILQDYEYKFISPWYENKYKENALLVLRAAGWDIPKEQLKLMIVRGWA